MSKGYIPIPTEDLFAICHVSLLSFNKPLCELQSQTQNLLFVMLALDPQRANEILSKVMRVQKRGSSSVFIKNENVSLTKKENVM